ncbi:hypothetical protein, conserved [Trypanosoma brucei gambiense DAL972]|uniref:Transmembrane protein n=2 Tax=Trypanosoma brucei TaxID=5691 RepID=Q4GZD4_TRYB2|nr:hypothetical protein, conserved [Trypanosoma brucei brucei TREU927]XP_011771273.1 hypothetical protein, conserved [Trypanosoma brucei gambiense DAL972]CAJ16002.1 hypothetical protein, conserved [Trypanosoma brucei brucei TREU927]CBH08832.1 hypothetical protein, conserved [Trypanosoma brucei gambiense DAL972]|eukprot:XP_011771273.1 hypothetical protein, conserved [Trypanosoma brucei gambiense DAL972]
MIHHVSVLSLSCAQGYWWSYLRRLLKFVFAVLPSLTPSVVSAAQPFIFIFLTMRRMCVHLCRAAAAAASVGSSNKSDPIEEKKQKADNIFTIRRSPASLYESTMHSNTLSDHPLTHRARRNELAYRKRRLTERGNYEQAAEAEAEAERRDREGRGGAETREYYSAICFVVLGYLTAHGVVFKRFYPQDLQLNYSPDRGYSDEVAARRKELAAINEMVGVSVLESVYSKEKAKIKSEIDA